MRSISAPIWQRREVSTEARNILATSLAQVWFEDIAGIYPGLLLIPYQNVSVLFFENSMGR